jgi:hypothetical protein
MNLEKERQLSISQKRLTKSTELHFCYLFTNSKLSGCIIRAPNRSDNILLVDVHQSSISRLGPLVDPGVCWDNSVKGYLLQIKYVRWSTLGDWANITDPKYDVGQLRTRKQHRRRYLRRPNVIHCTILQREVVTHYMIK